MKDISSDTTTLLVSQLFALGVMMYPLALLGLIFIALLVGGQCIDS